MSKKILVVEDELYTAEQISMLLERLGYTTIGPATNAEDAIKIAKNESPELILMDIVLEGSQSGKLDGISTAEKIKEFLDVPIVFLTAYGDKTTVNRAKYIEPSGYLIKPITTENELRPVVEVALYNHEIRQEIVKKSQKFTQIKELLQNDGSVATMVVETPQPIPADLKFSDYYHLFNALGNAERWHVLTEIFKESQSFNYLRKAIDKSKSTLSHHLSILEENHLILNLRKGKTSVYEFSNAGHAMFAQIVEKIPSLDEALQMFIAMGNQERLSIFDKLVYEKLRSKDMEDLIEKTQSTVAHHLRIMQEANLLEIKKEGRAIYYYVTVSSHQIFAGFIQIFQNNL